MKSKLFYMSVDDAVQKMMTVVNIKPGFEVVPIREAYGRVLAEDVISKVDLPPSDVSHFDGYAIRAEDTIRASVGSPVFLRVIGRIYPEERAKRRVNPGEVYISPLALFCMKALML